jgi:hypothetical protein
MTMITGSPVYRTDEIRGTLTGRTIPLAERMRTGGAEMISEEEPIPEDYFDPDKILFRFFFTDFMEKLRNGDEEETGNVTLAVDY